MISKKNFAKVSATLGAVALGVSATATAANADTIYTVQSGDTLSGISYKFAKDNSMVNDLAKKNNIQDINKKDISRLTRFSQSLSTWAL